MCEIVILFGLVFLMVGCWNQKKEQKAVPCHMSSCWNPSCRHLNCDRHYTSCRPAKQLSRSVSVNNVYSLSVGHSAHAYNVGYVSIYILGKK